MVKIRKKILQHKQFLPIVNELLIEPHNSLSLSKSAKLNIKDQSSINNHLKYYFKEGFIVKSEINKTKYKINFNKIIEEFYEYIYSLNSILILNTENKKAEEKKVLSKEFFFKDLKYYKENIIIKKLFEKLLIYYSYDFEKYIGLTLEDTFNGLIKLILILKTEEINFFLKDFKSKNDKLIFNEFIDNIKHNTISFEGIIMKLELGFMKNPLNLRKNLHDKYK